MPYNFNVCDNIYRGNLDTGKTIWLLRVFQTFENNFIDDISP